MNAKKIAIWLSLVIVVLVLYFSRSELFDIRFLEGFVAKNTAIVMLVYIAILSVLGLFFIPSTPFAIAGVFIFSPMEAYMLNIVGIITSSTIVYYFSHYLGLDKVFEEKCSKKILLLKQKFRENELLIIIGWSFFPVVPTDLVIYVASGLKVKLSKCLLGVIVGEGTLNLFYILSIHTLIFQ